MSLERVPHDDATAEGILARFSDLENNPHETISPYVHFNVDGKLYYFTPGGFLYCRESGTEEIGASSAATSPMRSGATEPTMT